MPIAVVALLYARLDGQAVLDHGTRRALVARVRERPGLHLSVMADELGVDPKTIAYHVRQLARVGGLRVERDGRALRCYLPGDAPRRAPDPRSRLALWALYMGASGPAGVARALGIPRGTAGSLLERLLERGLVVREGDAFRPREPFSGERDLGAP